MASIEIDVTTLKDKSSELDRLKNNANNTYDKFTSSYLNTCSSPIEKLHNIVKAPIERFKKGFEESSKWLSNYLTDLDTVESNLQAFKGTNIIAPTEFTGKFEDLFSKITMPVLKTNGNKYTNYVNFGGGIIINGEVLDIGSGGQFVADSSKGIYGYIISSIDGKKHVVFRQSQISGWATNCNRAAAASIASAYTNNPWNAVNAANRGGIGYNSKVTNNYFNKFGLSANVRNVKGSYDSIKKDLVDNLCRGNYVMFDLSEPKVKGRSGQRWTSTRHWLSILDIKKTGNGPNDYAIFVSDSGHKGSTVNHGLGTGWYSIDEFSGQRIENFTTVSPTGRKT